jgi:ribose 5-phosphate isomerase B
MNKQKVIYIGSDHAGFALKEKLKIWFDTKKILYKDLGNLKYNKNDDYPDYAASVARAVVKHKTQGILICGSAEGVCIAANKIKGTRAVNPSSIAQTRLSREHENANILCLSGGKSRIPQHAIALTKATRMIKVFITTSPSKATRHLRRIKKISKLER